MALRQTYFALKLKTVKGRGYETYNSKKVKEEHKKAAKADMETETELEEEQEVIIPLVTHVNNILHSIFSNVEVYINNQQNYNSNELYGRISHSQQF